MILLTAHFEKRIWLSNNPISPKQFHMKLIHITYI